MNRNNDTNLALFLDFDNVAIGARDARQRFDIDLVLARLLEKGKIVVKKAYADWSYYQNYMVDLHAAAIEMIEIPSPRQSGKNSADIRMVVDAMDLCYSKDHIDVFVLVSGDSDFSPLVSKLRENNKEVIGVGMKGSSSKLLIANCDEFIFYEDLSKGPVSVESVNLDTVPADKKKLFNLLVTTIEGLTREHKGPLYSSLVKDTMKRKKPDFNERSWGYSSFSDLLEEAMSLGLLTAERDERAGGTFVVTAVGGTPGPLPASTGPKRSSRRRGRRRGGRGGDAARQDQAAAAETQDKPTTGEKPSSPDKPKPESKPSVETKPTAEKPSRKKAAKKAQTRKVAKKAPAKKTTKKAVTKKPVVKKTTRRAPAKKTTKKAAAGKPAKKTTTKKTAGRRTTKKSPAKT